MQSRSVQHLVQGRGARLAYSFPDIQHPHAQGSGSEGDLQHIAFAHLVGCLGGLAIDRDMSRISRLVRHSAPLDDTGNLQILVKAHISSGQP